MIPSAWHADPDVDAWCVPCKRGKYDAAGDRCPRPAWHRPDPQRHGVALGRRAEIARQLQAGRLAYRKRIEERTQAARELG